MSPCPHPNHCLGRDLAWLTLAIGLLYLLFLGSHGIVDPDEGRYSEVAREMLASGHWLSPTIDGVPFWDKPILFYWLQMLAMHFWGVNAWSIRFFPMLSGVGSCLIVYGVGAQCFNRATGILSALILASMPLFFGLAHFANMDVEVAFWLTGTIGFGFWGVRQAEQGQSAKAAMLTAFGFAAAAFLTKGLMGIVFPLMIFGVWTIVFHQWRLLPKLHLPLGLLLFAVLVLPWFLWMTWHYSGFLNYFFIYEQVSRFTSENFNSQQPFWYYGALVVVGLLPWLGFLVQSYYHHWQAWRRERGGHVSTMILLLWPLLILIFFSIPASKLPGYIIPVFPPLALLIGHYWQQQWQSRTWGVKAAVLFGLGVLGVEGVALVLAPHWVHTLHPHYFINTCYWALMGVVLALLVALISLLTYYRSWLYVFVAMELASLLVLVLALRAIVDFPINTVQPLTSVVQSQIKPQDVVVSYEQFFQGVPLYLQRPVIVVNDWHNQTRILENDGWPRMLYLGMQRNPAAKAWLIEPAAFWTLWCGPKTVWVFAFTNARGDFQQHACPWHEVARTNGMMVLVNR